MYRPVKLTKEKPSQLFDIESVTFSDSSISGTSFWKEYIELKMDINSQYVTQSQEAVEKFKKKIQKRNTNRDDLWWTNAMWLELNRDQAMVKLHEANNQTYLKFSQDLTTLDQWVQTQNKDFIKKMDEFRTKEGFLILSRKELELREKNLHERLDKIESLISQDSEKNQGTIYEMKRKLETAATNYDELLLREYGKRPELFKKSIEVEQQQKDRERQRLEFLVNRWQQCLSSLQDDVNKYANDCFDVKALVYSEGINIDLIVNSSYENKNADYSDFETSSSIISRRPNIEKLFPKPRGKQRLTTYDGFDADFVAKYNKTLEENEIKNDKSTELEEMQEKCVDDTADTSNIVNPEDETPKEFLPYKAMITRNFKKSREGEMSIKRGDKVKVLDKPNGALVFVEKKTFFNLRKKRGLVPFTHLLPLDTK